MTKKNHYTMHRIMTTKTTTTLIFFPPSFDSNEAIQVLNIIHHRIIPTGITMHCLRRSAHAAVTSLHNSTRPCGAQRQMTSSWQHSSARGRSGRSHRRRGGLGQRPTAATLPTLPACELTEEMTETLCRISQSLLEDEAAAFRSALPPVSLHETMITPHSGEGGIAEDMISTIMLDDVNSTGTDMLTPSAGDAISAALPHDMSTRSDVSSQALNLITMNSRVAPSPALHAATALLTHGMDVKAVLVNGRLDGLKLRNQSLGQADFSGTHWSSVQAHHCDFSNSIFYGAAWSDVSLSACNLNGCVLREVQLQGDITFRRCSFRRATMGLIGRCAGKAIHITFDECDFDLSSWEDCQGLNIPSFFVRCVNIETAFKFPLRST